MIGPTTALQFSADLVTSADGNPLNSVAARAVNSATERAPRWSSAVRVASASAASTSFTTRFRTSTPTSR